MAIVEGITAVKKKPLESMGWDMGESKEAGENCVEISRTRPQGSVYRIGEINDTTESQ